jgi:DNA-binding NarL/FixJ family response regulator
MDKKIKLLLVDDHKIVRDGLKAVLASETDLEIIAEAGDGDEGIKKVREFHPDVVIMDLLMPGLSGLDATVAIKSEFPQVKIMILTVSERHEDLLQALRFGADAYLLKNQGVAEVKAAVRQIAFGESAISPPMAGKLMDEFKKKSAEPFLTERELETLKLLSEGLTNSEIAGKLILEEITIRKYLESIMDKLHVRNRVEAANYYHRHFM